MNDVLTLPPNSLAGRGPGDNSTAAPLREVLADELEPARRRAADLLAAAREARIENAEDAAKIADLIALLRDHERAVDRAREARKAPFLANQRTIEAAFGAVIGPMARARTDTLAPMLSAWQEKHGDEALATSIAAVGSRREIQFCIEDLPAAIAWLLQHHGGALAQAARTIIGAALRSYGVEAAGIISIPGVSVTIQNKVQVR